MMPTDHMGGETVQLVFMRTDELDFDLPPDLIAQAPPADRSESRLLHFARGRDYHASPLRRSARAAASG